MRSIKRIPPWLNVILASSISLVIVWRILALMDSEEDVFRDPRQRARIRLAFAQQHAESLRSHHATPTTLEEILAGLPHDRRTYFEFDPWQRRIRFARDSSKYELRSAGPDSLFDNADDIVVSGRLK